MSPVVVPPGIETAKLFWPNPASEFARKAIATYITIAGRTIEGVGGGVAAGPSQSSDDTA